MVVSISEQKSVPYLERLRPDRLLRICERLAQRREDPGAGLGQGEVLLGGRQGVDGRDAGGRERVAELA